MTDERRNELSAAGLDNIAKCLCGCVFHGSERDEKDCREGHRPGIDKPVRVREHPLVAEYLVTVEAPSQAISDEEMARVGTVTTAIVTGAVEGLAASLPPGYTIRIDRLAVGCSCADCDRPVIEQVDTEKKRTLDAEVRSQRLDAINRQLEVEVGELLRQKLAASGPLRPGELDATLRESDDLLRRFGEHQSARDRAQERRDYVANCALRLVAANRKNVLERPLAELPDFPEQGYPSTTYSPYVVAWRGKHYRICAQVPRGVVEGASHTFQYEIVAHEIAEADPLRDYEREAGPYEIKP